MGIIKKDYAEFPWIPVFGFSSPWWTPSPHPQVGGWILDVTHVAAHIMKILSGKLTKNYGKSPFSMGKSTINHHFQ